MDRLAYDQLREELADLEHEQWVHWTEYMLANLTSENIERWKGQCLRPYSALSEREKESDRTWADKVLEILATYTMNEYPTSMLVLEIATRPDCKEALERVMGMKQKENDKIRSILDRDGLTMDNIDCECRACNPKCPGNCEDCLKEREEWKKEEHDPRNDSW